MKRSSSKLSPNSSRAKFGDNSGIVLANKNGLRAVVAEFGAAVVELWAPDRRGKVADVALGIGRTMGRYANRIAGAEFVLDGKRHRLPRNEGANCLHGGRKGFDKRVWKGERLSASSARFTRRSPDGEERFPGNLDVSVAYTLNDRDQLIIAYEARTDKPTVVNLTNHTYFNLAGAGNGDILGHEVRIYADRCTPAAADGIPTGEIKRVAGTPLDFRRRAVVGARFKKLGTDPVGYDHNYVLRRRGLAAEAYERRSGRLLRVYTDQPGLQFYTGNHLDGTVPGKGGKPYRRYAGLCLETQHFPDSPHHANFPSTVLRPGRVFRSTTVYEFSCAG